MKLYNTLSGQLEEFKPLEDNKVTMYVCGPTVYDYPHLGHARCYITWDTVVRYLRFKGYEVTYVRNITDVDDKIIKKAKDTNTTPADISQKYYEEFQKSMKALNVEMPDIEPKATEHIAEMINIAQTLIEKGYAYEINGDVYFRVKKYAKYGQLGNKNVEDLESGARVEISEQKENPLDFALWKSVKDDSEISWDSPWGKGRPGWHIECSAMSEKYLGKTIDIHAGGLDLTFPHHENERAQSECAFGQEFVKYWLHNGFVLTNKEKMSKSLGNFVTIGKLLEKFDSNTIRFFILTNHYRTPVDFNEEGLFSAKAGIKKIVNAVQEGFKFAGDDGIRSGYDNWKFHAVNMPKYSENDAKRLDKPVFDIIAFPKEIQHFILAMDNDLNTSQAVAHLFSLATEVNKQKDADNKELCGKYAVILKELSHVLGFKIKEKKQSLNWQKIRETLDLNSEEEQDSSKNENLKISVEEIEIKIEQRKTAKLNKDWATADKIRDELKNLGIVLKDEKDGTTSWECID